MVVVVSIRSRVRGSNYCAYLERRGLVIRAIKPGIVGWDEETVVRVVSREARWYDFSVQQDRHRGQSSGEVRECCDIAP